VRRNPNAIIIHANETLIRSEDLSFKTSINVNVYQSVRYHDPEDCNFQTTLPKNWGRVYRERITERFDNPL
jgi:hypothetical protein